MKKTICLFLITVFAITSLYALSGDVNISKDLKEDSIKAQIYLYKDFEIKTITLKPYIIYTNFFKTTEKITSNKPFLDIYQTGVEISKGNIYIQYEHGCAHEVISTGLYNLSILNHGYLQKSIVDYITIGYRWGKK